MQEAAFRDLLTTYLAPMLSGTIRLGSTFASTKEHALAVYKTPVALLLKPSRDENYRVELLRSQAFPAEEKDLVRSFIDRLSGIADQSLSPFFADLMAGIPRRTIAKFLPYHYGTGALEKAIRQFEALAPKRMRAGLW